MQRKIFKDGLIVDVCRQRIFKGWFSVLGGRFELVEEDDITTNEPCEIIDLGGKYVVPGLIDAHMHVESSLVNCRSFARAALREGTVAVLQDPHEMANVFGRLGVQFMIEDAERQPLSFYCAIPSCVPTTRKNLETANAVIEPEDVEELARYKNVIALGEVMDYRGLLNGDEKLLKILQVAKEKNLLIEGHCPTLSGEELSKYIFLGVGSDHTLMNKKKIAEELSKGMCVMMQEKSLSEENITAIMSLPDRSRVLLVTDDVPPTKLVDGHLNKVVVEAVRNGWDKLDAIASATIRAASYLRLKDLGAISPGKRASFFLCEDLESLQPTEIYCDGVPFSQLRFQAVKSYLEKFFISKLLSEEDFKLTDVDDGVRKLNVVVMNQNNTFTDLVKEEVKIKSGFALGNYVNVGVFHRKTLKGHVGLLKGLGMQKGAFASSFAHDSHNLLVVGKCSWCMKRAVEELFKMGGGMVYCDRDNLVRLPLEIGGIISDREVEDVAKDLTKIEELLKESGASHKNLLTFLTVLSLTVSPRYKFSDLGIVDVESCRLLRNL
ncbi:adenine deaminase C-terminal domain-containing protein [Pseudothermotoga sp. U03pept]|uniref:adenine deaminase C-terminal domain-containing protein n=1 Tax=Pseudothermotoga sp. U03pept TaxID=3447012 RepID=UPI003F079740